MNITRSAAYPQAHAISPTPARARYILGVGFESHKLWLPKERLSSEWAMDRPILRPREGEPRQPNKAHEELLGFVSA